MSQGTPPGRGSSRRSRLDGYSHLTWYPGVHCSTGMTWGSGAIRQKDTIMLRQGVGGGRETAISAWRQAASSGDDDDMTGARPGTAVTCQRECSRSSEDDEEWMHSAGSGRVSTSRFGPRPRPTGSEGSLARVWRVMRHRSAKSPDRGCRLAALIGCMV